MYESGNESTSESQFSGTHTGIVALAVTPGSCVTDTWTLSISNDPCMDNFTDWLMCKKKQPFYLILQEFTKHVDLTP